MDTKATSDTEIWRPAHGYEGFYEVSNLGNVTSIKRNGTLGGPMKLFADQYGYIRVNLRKKGVIKQVGVHRLVLEAFVCPRPQGKVSAHWNGNPGDNRIENLRWATQRENWQDRKRHGRFACGEASPQAKLTEKEVIEMRIRRNRGEFFTHLAKEYGVTYATARSAIIGRHWKHI